MYERCECGRDVQLRRMEEDTKISRPQITGGKQEHDGYRVKDYDNQYLNCIEVFLDEQFFIILLMP